MPSPKLTVAYTAPFVVVPGKDAKIRVTLKNIGYGTAHNLTIQSAQPRVAATLSSKTRFWIIQGRWLIHGFRIFETRQTVAVFCQAISQSASATLPQARPCPVTGRYKSIRGIFHRHKSTFTHSDFNGLHSIRYSCRQPRRSCLQLLAQ